MTLLRETLVHTFSGFRLEFTYREILRGRSPTKQTPGNLQVLGRLVALNEEKGAIEHWNSPSTLGKPAHSSSGSVTERRAGMKSDQRRLLREGSASGSTYSTPSLQADPKEDKIILRFFQHLIRRRALGFLRGGPTKRVEKPPLEFNSNPSQRDTRTYGGSEARSG